MNIKTKIGVISMASLGMAGTIVGSAIAAIAQSFPDVPISTVQLLSTLPGLGSLLITLIAGQMAMRISKKTLVLLGIALVTIGGMIPAFWNQSIYGLLACSIILGMGVGFISTLSPMLLSQYFDGEERSTMMGINTGVTSLGAMILTAIGGYLGGSHWQNLYLVYSFGIVIFFITLFCLPKDQVERTFTNKEKQKQTKQKLNTYVFIVYFVVFLLGIAFTAYMANLSIVVAEKGMGGTTLTGFINAVGTIGGIATGLGFKYVRKFTKPNTLAFGFIFLLITLVLTYFFANTAILMIAAIFSSVSMVTVMATAPFMLSMLSEPQQIPLVMSLYAFVNGLSSAIAPKIISLLHIPAGTPSFIFAGVICLAVILLLLLTNFEKKTESGRLLPEG